MENETKFGNEFKLNKKFILIVLLAIIVIFIGLFIYFKSTNGNILIPVDIVSSDDKDNEDILVNKELLNDLVYLPFNSLDSDYYPFHWQYVDINVNDITPTVKIEIAASKAKLEENVDGEIPYYKTKVAVEEEFKKLFGPDVPFSYEDTILPGSNDCGGVTKYHEDKEIFEIVGACGWEYGPISFGGIESNPYKVEKINDDIYVYVDYLYVLKEEGMTYLFKIFPKQDVDYFVSETNNEEISSISTAVINGKNPKEALVIASKEGNTNKYKFTFRKQSDGKYYFYSGEVQ